MTMPCGLISALILSLAPAVGAEQAPEPVTVESPNGRIRVTFRLDAAGKPGFEVAGAGRDRSRAARSGWSCSGRGCWPRT